jgi:predicted RNase H-like HicB family nuclease
MRQYIALVHADPDGGLTVTLPDFPGLFAGVGGLDKVRDLMTEALASHIEAMQRAGEALPQSSSFESLMADPRNADCAAMLIWAKGGKRAARRRDDQVDSLHAQSNDEWPEADA